MDHDSRHVPSALLRARLIGTEEVIELNNKAKTFRWVSLDSATLVSRIAFDDRHCIFPMLRFASNEEAVEYYRCYLWFKEAGNNMRTLVILDVSEDDLQTLPPISEPLLNRLVKMLLEEIPVTTLTG